MIPEDLPESSLLAVLDGARIVYFDGRLHETALVVAHEVITYSICSLFYANFKSLIILKLKHAKLYQRSIIFCVLFNAKPTFVTANNLVLQSLMTHYHNGSRLDRLAYLKEKCIKVTTLQETGMDYGSFNIFLFCFLQMVK